MTFPIFQKLGGDRAALDLIASRREGEKLGGKPPSEPTLKRWKMRGIPGHIQSLLADECAQRGIPVSFDDMKWKSKRKRRAA